MSWYKDRDFPELKRERFNEPGEILAIIPDPKDIERVIKAHDEEVEEILKLAEGWKKGYKESENKFKEEISNLKQTIEELKFEIQELKEKEEARDWAE